jgi:hypothetical protein
MDDLKCPLENIRIVVGNPFDAQITSKPGVLATCESSSSALGVFDGLILRPFTIKELQRLRVAKGASGRDSVTQTERIQASNLINEPLIPHPINSLVNAPIELISRHIEPNLHRRVDICRHRKCGYELLACYLNYFKSSYDPTAVHWRDGLRRCRI